jgi:hypothetical protein
MYVCIYIHTHIHTQDSIDGVCPKSKACPSPGGFPQCIDGQKLVNSIKNCRSSYDFEVWEYNKGLNPEKPTVRPKPKPRPKYITPHNRMVGALMITQQRKQTVNCLASNDKIQAYLDQSGVVPFVCTYTRMHTYIRR